MKAIKNDWGLRGPNIIEDETIAIVPFFPGEGQKTRVKSIFNSFSSNLKANSRQFCLQT